MTAEIKDCGVAFSDELLTLARSDDRLVMVNNDSIETHYATRFQEELPTRLFNVGIAEQNMVGVACGLANAGKIPYVYSAGCFLATRAMEQIKVDVAYTRANIRLCSFVSGLAYGPLGGTHHTLEDLAWMRAIPNLTVVCPGDSIETRALLNQGHTFTGPIYFRLTSKTRVPDIAWGDARHEIGKGVTLRQGDDVLLIGTGIMTGKLLNVADALDGQGISASVVHIATLAPLDRELIVTAAKGKTLVVTAEEHSIVGGLGSAVAEVLAEDYPVRMVRIGTPHQYSPIGPADWLYEYHGLTEDAIFKKVMHAISRVR